MNNKKYANLLNKIKMKERTTKAIAMAMCVILCVTSIDITAFAFTGEAGSDKNIVGITSLSEEIANQKVKPDATLEDIKLPESLDVHVSYQVEKEIEVEVEEEKATPTPTPSVEPTPSAEPTPSVEVKPTEEPKGEEVKAQEETNKEDNQKSEESEQNVPADEPTEESNQPDDTQNENPESQADGEQVAKITYGEYDSVETVYVPMTYYAAEPSKEEVVVETLEKSDVADMSDDKKTESKTEIKKETVIEKVEEDDTVSVTWAIDEENSSKAEFKELEAGEKYIFVPAITEDGYKLAEDVQLPIITVTVEEKQAAFEKSVTVDDVVITVMADDGVFPEDATIEARKVTTSEEKEAAEAVDEVRAEEKNVAVSYTFDITIKDKDGNEIEPKNEKGSVKVTFKMAEIANENLETDVYHLAETSDGLNAENLDVNTDEGEADEAAVETTGFSFYTVEFTYKGLQYVLEGDEKVALSEILEAVEIKENGEISKVEGSDDELFKPVFDEEEKTWYIEALKAFNTEEWLKVTIGGVEYEIVVTDDNDNITNWSDLKSALSGEDGTIILGADITAGSGDTTLTVTGTKTLDLNGYVINGAGQTGSVVTISNNATLTLADSNSTASHTGDYASLPAGGAITGGNASYGGGININGTFIMNGGNITGNNATNKGGGVFLNGTSFTMNGGNIASNTAAVSGGGVSVDKNTFYMNGGSIVDNIANGNGGNGGGGVFLAWTGVVAKFNMSGGKIIGNKATAGRGGGVFAGSYSNMSMTGGEIAYNYASGANVNDNGGGGVLTNGPFIMTAGSIHHNAIGTGVGGGVYRCLSTDSRGDNTTLGGTAQITNNVIGGTITKNDDGSYSLSNGTADNLYLDESTRKRVVTLGSGDKAPAEGMNIGVTVATAPTLSNPVSIVPSNETDYSSCFSSDNLDYAIKYDSDKIVKLMKAGAITNGTPESAKATNFGYISIDKETALAGETVTVTVTSNKAYTLKNLKYNDGSNDYDITNNSFTMPAANVTVSAEFEHNHSFTYSVNGNVLKATCIDGCLGGYYANPLTLTLTKPANLAYDGNAKEISFASEEKTKWEATGTGLGMVPTITYAAKTGSSLTDNKPVKVGSYTASITVSDKTASLDFEITKAASSVTNAPVANSLTYNGTEQALVSAGTASGGTMNYAIGNDGTTEPTSGWSTSIPTGKNAGDYYVWYKSVGDNDHSDTAPVCVTVTVAKKSIIVSGITATNRGYEADNKTVTLVTANATLAEKVDGDDLSVTATGEMADANAGENKKVTIKDLTLAGNDKGNYELAASGQQTETTVTITKASSSVTIAPSSTAPTYRGSEEALVTAGAASGGTMNYAIGNDGTTAPTSDWSIEIPGGKDARTYYVWYKSIGDSNHSDTTPVCVTVTVAKKSITVSGITATNRGYEAGNKTVTLVTTGATLTGKVDGDDLSVTATGEMADANAGENKSVTIKNLTLAGAGKDNYELASSGRQTSTTVTITKASHTVTAPTARNPVYNGNEQVLISAGSCTTGTIKYSLDGTDYYDSIDSIKKKEVGSYTVYYKAEGDGNYETYGPKSITAKIVKKSDPTPTPTPTPKPDPQPTPNPDPQPNPQPTIPVTSSVQYAETGNPIKNYVANNPTGSNIPLPFITTDGSKAGWKTIDEALDAHKAKYKKNAVGTLSITMNGSTTVDTKLITDAHEKKIPLSFALDDEVAIGIPVANTVLSDQAKEGKTTYFNVSSMTTAEAVGVKKAHAGLLPSDIVAIGGDANTPVVLTLCSNDKLSTKKSQLMTITFNAKKAGFKKGDKVYLYCGTSQNGIAMYKSGKVDKNGLVTFSVPMVSNYWTIGSKNMNNKLLRNAVALPR